MLPAGGWTVNMARTKGRAAGFANAEGKAIPLEEIGVMAEDVSPEEDEETPPQQQQRLPQQRCCC